MRDVTLNISDRLEKFLRGKAKKYRLSVSEFAKDLLRLGYGMKLVNSVMEKYETDTVRRNKS